jgi:Fe2+ transport system protein FeoA
VEILLSELEIKGKCRVIKLQGDRRVRRRLLEMGFIKGTELIIKKVAPLGDPMELEIKGYHLSLRVSEARHILVENDSCRP